uniref:Methyltransferase type 12 domain-containing protein n=2 Tax=Entomoneis paludosa TaxID=265537 RepID=A0A7S2VC87_9STRA|mmetsp:Transcript_16381/g.33822  ORF Transcript_16381/g.33822 Transcript_16381/m.33822 type:complete len:355 (+) Transcript_16381:105-1169(+)
MRNKKAAFLILIGLAGSCSTSAFLSSPFSHETSKSVQRVLHKSRTQAKSVLDAKADDGVEELKPTQEWDVGRYQSQHSFVWKYGSSLIDLVEPKRNINKTTNMDQTEYARILDVGCGSGELTQALADKFPDCVVHGTDYDTNMVKKASTQFPNLHFFQDDARTLLKKADGDYSGSCYQEYDVIFSNAALHWVPPHDAKQAVESIANALRPGGQLVVEFGGKGNVDSIVCSTNRALQEICGPGALVEPFWYFPSIGEFASLLEEYDIEVQSAVLFDRPTPLAEGEKGLSNWMKMFGSKFLDSLSDEMDLKERVLRHVENQLRPLDHLWNGEQWMADYRRIRIVGIKKCASGIMDS